MTKTGQFFHRDNVLALKPRHRVMIEQAAIRLPTEKQSAFFDRVTGELQRRQFCSTDAVRDSDITDAIEQTLTGLQYSRSTFP